MTCRPLEVRVTWRSSCPPAPRTVWKMRCDDFPGWHSRQALPTAPHRLEALLFPGTASCSRTPPASRLSPTQWRSPAVVASPQSKSPETLPFLKLLVQQVRADRRLSACGPLDEHEMKIHSWGGGGGTSLTSSCLEGLLAGGQEEARWGIRGFVL